MQELLKNLPEIIKVAASSNRGIVALMLIVMSGLAFGFFHESKEGWRFAALVLLFLGCIAFGYAVLATFRRTKPRFENVDLPASIDVWVKEAEEARSANTISPGRALPSTVLDARNRFESAWKHAALVELKAIDAALVYKALSYLNRLYRIVENDSLTKQHSNYWSDQAIEYFEEIQDREHLTEALLDKAAIYLDIAQLGHSDKVQFESTARNGDAVMTKAYGIAGDEQRPTVLRISSRFFYNLARPKSFRLSENWDNNYLLLSYQKAKEAYQLEPTNIKNANQLARVTIKVSKNPPQDRDKDWAKRLRESQESLKAVWLANRSVLTGLDQRLSPLNVLGVLTLETAAREWGELDPSQRKETASRYISELDADAVSPLREAVALLQNSELRISYGFDLYYDIARTHALKTAVVRTLSRGRARQEFEELKRNLLSAKESAKTSQLEASVQDISKEITFGFLNKKEKEVLTRLLSIGAIESS